MRQSTRTAVLKALDAFATKGVWVFNVRALSRLSGVDEHGLVVYLGRNADIVGVRKVFRGHYLNPRVDPPIHGLAQLVAILRPGSPSYLSLESVLHAVDWISQIPNRMTFVTTGRSALYQTPLGIIEFNRVSGDKFSESRLSQTRFDPIRQIRVATPELALADLTAIGRNLDLVRPEAERNYDYLLEERHP
jgi:predicted transcriptional regulator of viral defense system